MVTFEEFKNLSPEEQLNIIEKIDPDSYNTPFWLERIITALNNDKIFIVSLLGDEFSEIFKNLKNLKNNQ
jgi:hypothetical protein